MEEKKENILQKIWNHIRGELFEEEDAADIISNNAKSVLIGLFILIGLAIIFYVFAVSDEYFTKGYNDQTISLNQTLSNPISAINISKVYDLAQKQLNLTEQLQNNINNSLESNNNNSDNTILSHEKLAQEIAEITQNQAQVLTQSTGTFEEIGDKINDLQRRDQLLDQVNSVFIAAITGAIALGGSLITQLWGRKE